MRAFHAGEFEVGRLSRAMRPFCPVEAFHALESIPLEGLRNRGKKLILLDVDNTLVKWKGEDFSAEVVAWIDEAKSLGFNLCILSNTRRPARLQRVCEKLGVKTVRDRFKPSTRMYRLALKEFDVKAEEAVMIGDQLLTDILGANRSGIEAIWVHRIHDHEFIGTRVNRIIERFIISRLYQAIPIVAEMPESAARETLAMQFFKFGVVGLTSMFIDLTIFFVLYGRTPWPGGTLSGTLGSWVQSHGWLLGTHTPADASIPILKGVSGSFAIVNSFIWNRRWTFGIKSKAEASSQFTRFVILSVSGLALGAALATGFAAALPKHQPQRLLVANLLAIVIVAFWNFGGQRLWAFKKR